MECPNKFREVVFLQYDDPGAWNIQKIVEYRKARRCHFQSDQVSSNYILARSKSYLAKTMNKSQAHTFIDQALGLLNHIKFLLQSVKWSVILVVVKTHRLTTRSASPALTATGNVPD